MEIASHTSVEPVLLPLVLGHEQDVDSVIRRIVAGKQPLDRRLDRRRDVRYAFPYPLKLQPLASALRGECQQTVAAIGKHITLHGIDFYTALPLAAKEVICQVDSGGSTFSLVLELSWCRHNAQGWFENGGRFQRLWKSPAELE